jgi:hypothetical protein
MPKEKELSEADKKALQKCIRKCGDELLQVLKEEIFLCEITCDVDRFERLEMAIGHHTAYELLHNLREAGLGKDITALADKAGKKLKRKKEKEANAKGNA